MEIHNIAQSVTSVYALTDPRETDTIKRVRYIGKAKNPDRRFGEHLVSARCGKRTYCYNWIRRLLSNGLLPGLEILSVVSDSDAYGVEQGTIAKFKFLGAPLTNLTDGGSGTLGYHHSDKAKQGISVGHIGKKPFLGRHHSDEAKLKDSKAHLGRKFSVEHCAKLSAAHKGKKQSAETVAKRVLANTGKKRSVESLARMSAANKGQVSWNKGKKSSPEAIAKMIGNKNALGNKNRLGSRHSEEAKLKMSVSHRAYWARKKALLAEVLV